MYKAQMFDDICHYIHYRVKHHLRAAQNLRDLLLAAPRASCQFASTPGDAKRQVTKRGHNGHNSYNSVLQQSAPRESNINSFKMF